MPIGDYFKPEEFACHCDRGAKCEAFGKQMDMGTVLALNGVRREFGEPMVINRGISCPYWNEKIGGEDHSWHLVGKAVDVHCPDGVYMLNLLRVALKHGFRVGVKKRMLHLDKGDGPQVLFGY